MMGVLERKLVRLRFIFSEFDEGFLGGGGGVLVCPFFFLFFLSS